MIKLCQDSITQVASLPAEKLVPLWAGLAVFLHNYRRCLLVTKRKQLSLIGKLAFAAKVIPVGQFLYGGFWTVPSVPHLDLSRCRWSPPENLSPPNHTQQK